ncbi:MAG: Ku protein [Verrucomicrobia bacterium]|nr:Ku protein [Verrucomicrobiota bacterium]
MKAIWKGWLSFGLINIPVNLYSATVEKELSFHLLHKKDLSPIHYTRLCDKDGKEVPWEEVVKGYELEKGRFVVLTDDDFEKANIKRVRSIEILDFVDGDEIDTVFYEKPYYLEPQKGGARAYLLLYRALLETGRVGVTKFVLRNREHLGVIKPYKNMLVLNQLRFANELKLPAIDLPKGAFSKKEIEIAMKLIGQSTVKFNPKHYKDEYHDELLELIKRKAKGKGVRSKGKAPTKTVRSDLTAVLRASLHKRHSVHHR